MRVERLGRDKVRFYLSMDDLLDRGINKEDMWRDIPKVHELFNDMMEQAYQELGFEIAGPVAVEVFALPTQGMVVVVTRGRTPETDDDLDVDDMYELEVTLEESEQIIFRFSDFEDLIQAAIRLQSLIREGGKVYAYQNQYFLVFDEEIQTDNLQAVIAILTEFGEPSTVTEHMLAEYGKPVMTQHAIEQLIRYFG
ncbi:genetic competence negative regulator [Polycladomyces subterraneus]|uniref:Adapter protein MecA n=1 Tax=Polycladomyces subterraneus TaxID=1016997 RepID=A0ABT8IN64_9BACL|nr:genetic competence negative regulator [Polycladomyces subterraneus]MDN4594193.1 genetic competence negative regulator [Polycladomyces subterraneus]